MQGTIITAGKFAKVTRQEEDGYALFVVQEHEHSVSEVFEDQNKALAYFEHTERYEAAQARKGRR